MQTNSTNARCRRVGLAACLPYCSHQRWVGNLEIICWCTGVGGDSGLGPANQLQPDQVPVGATRTRKATRAQTIVVNRYRSLFGHLVAYPLPVLSVFPREHSCCRRPPPLLATMTPPEMTAAGVAVAIAAAVVCVAVAIATVYAIIRALAPAPVPPLVQVLAGNPLAGAAVLTCLTTTDAKSLRLLHPALPATVARVPWADTDVAVMDVVRWRKALPAAVGACFTRSAVGDLERAAAALAGVTHVDLHWDEQVCAKLFCRLPASVRVLDISNCWNLADNTNLTHLTALVSLHCRGTAVLANGAAGLPPTLQELDISGITGRLPASISLAHLRALRVLRASRSALNVAALALLPPSLVELHAANCRHLTDAASFGHLPALRVLDVSECPIGDASLASLPPSLATLVISRFSLAAVLPPHLPALRVLGMSHAHIGDALVASLPPGLVELRLSLCTDATRAATWDHLPALRVVHSPDTRLLQATLAACRARGCVVTSSGDAVLKYQSGCAPLAVLVGGRVVSATGTWDNEVQVWDAPGGAPVACTRRPKYVLNRFDRMYSLAPLPDGRRVAIGTGTDAAYWGHATGGIEVWDVHARRPVRCSTIDCGSRGIVHALVPLADGRIAAGFKGDWSTNVWVVDVDVGAGAAVVLKGHKAAVVALVGLPDGRLVSSSVDGSMRV